jgi:maleate cis-trans isomerase
MSIPSLMLMTKPLWLNIISSNQISFWLALRVDGVRQAITGFGSLLRAI